MAPFTPFLSEELYRQLTGGESVHLLGWPSVGHVNELLISEMAQIRDLITQGLAQRAQAGLKVRQPLASATVVLPFDITEPDREELRNILAEEVNVKTVNCTVGEKPNIKLDTVLTPVLRREGMIRELVRQVQSARKAAGLQVDDRIELTLCTTHEQLKTAIKEHESIIKQETLATSLRVDHATPGDIDSSIDEADIAISLKKAQK